MAGGALPGRGGIPLHARWRRTDGRLHRGLARRSTSPIPRRSAPRRSATVARWLWMERSVLRLPPLPPKPDVPLDGLTPVPDLYGKLDPIWAACLWHPQKDTSYDGQPLRIRNVNYAKGYGMRAPAYLRYDLETRVVAICGAGRCGRQYACPRVGPEHCDVSERGLQGVHRRAAGGGKPRDAISQVPWRFDVPIPPGSRQIVLVCDDAGSRVPTTWATGWKPALCWKRNDEK